MAELTRRYVVMAMATEGPFDLHDPDAPFVLKPWKDPAALRALKTYRDACYPALARDLSSWIEAIEAGPVVRGDVGQRNQAHLERAAPSPPRKPAAARRPLPPATARRRPPRSGKRRR